MGNALFDLRSGVGASAGAGGCDACAKIYFAATAVNDLFRTIYFVVMEPQGLLRECDACG